MIWLSFERDWEIGNKGFGEVSWVSCLKKKSGWVVVMNEWMKKSCKTCFYAVVSIQTVICIDTSQLFWSMYRSIPVCFEAWSPCCFSQHAMYRYSLVCIDTSQVNFEKFEILKNNWHVSIHNSLYRSKTHYFQFFSNHMNQKVQKEISMIFN